MCSCGFTERYSSCNPASAGWRDWGITSTYVGVLGAPPAAGTFESPLDEVAMSALSLARADRQVLEERFIVVELIELPAEVTMTAARMRLQIFRFTHRLAFHPCPTHARPFAAFSIHPHRQVRLVGRQPPMAFLPDTAESQNYHSASRAAFHYPCTFPSFSPRSKEKQQQYYGTSV